LKRFSLDRADAISWLSRLPSASVDLIITDPAYESLEKHRAVGTTTRLKVSGGSSNAWFEIFPDSRFPELFQELYRVLRQNTHLYLFCDATTMFVAKPMAEAAGFRFWKPLVWDKRHIGMGYHYRSRHEFILFFEKGKRKLANLGTPDVLEVPRIHRGYPTEKPVDLMKILIEQSSSPGELILDPFFGSGAVGHAALQLNREFVGCDSSPAAFEHARIRLEALGASTDLNTLLSDGTTDNKGQTKLAFRRRSVE
jgi:site-specific DNA-methyltransferase (adenine-specific)